MTVAPDETLALVAWRLAAGVQATEELPGIAVDALLRGVDSPSLRELAGTSDGDVRDCRDRFWAACDELGVERPSLSPPAGPPAVLPAGTLAFRVEVVRTLLDTGQDAAAFGVVSMTELGAAWCKYTQWYSRWVEAHPDVEDGPPDDVDDAQVDSWAGSSARPASGSGAH